MFVYYGHYPSQDGSKIGKTTDLYGRFCQYNTSNPFEDFKCAALFQFERQEDMDAFEKLFLTAYENYGACYDPQERYTHRNTKNEWLYRKFTKEEIVSKLDETRTEIPYKLLDEEEMESELHKIRKREQEKEDAATKITNSWNEREYQTKTIDYCVQQLWKVCGRVYIELATGAGKSYIFYKIAQMLSPNIIVAFSSRVNINEQNVGKKYLSILGRKYAVYDCSKCDDDYDSFAEKHKYHIIVACVNSHNKVYGMLRGQKTKICIWFDEAHHAVEKWISNTSDEATQFLLTNSSVDYRVFTSASPDRQHVESHPSIFGTLYKPIKVSELISMGWLCSISPYVFGTDVQSGDINEYNLAHFVRYDASYGFSFHNCRDNAFELFKRHYDSYKNGFTEIRPFFLVGPGYDKEKIDTIDLDYDFRSVSKFMERPRSIAYICNMYKVGFDFDKLDYLIFSDPKVSWQDIIQSIGRGTRSDKRGHAGTNLFKRLKVMLPVFMNGKHTKYDNIVHVLQYLVNDANIMPNSISMDFGHTGRKKRMNQDDDGKYDGDEETKAVLLDLITRRQMKVGWNLERFVSLLRENNIHCRDDYNDFLESHRHMGIPECPGNTDLPEFTWEQTYEASPYYTEDECRTKIIKEYLDSLEEGVYDEGEEHEYLHEQDPKIPPVDFKSFYGSKPSW